jgi:hypothetical protein
MGRSLKPGDCFEKPELLELLVEVINYYLKGVGRIALTLPELNAFLMREEMSEASDYKGAVSKIIQICLQQRKRLGEYVGPRKGNIDMLDSLLALVVMEDAPMRRSEQDEQEQDRNEKAGEDATSPELPQKRRRPDDDVAGMLQDAPMRRPEQDDQAQDRNEKAGEAATSPELLQKRRRPDNDVSSMLEDAPMRRPEQDEQEQDMNEKAGEDATSPEPPQKRRRPDNDVAGMLEDETAKDTLLADLKRLVPLEVVLAIGDLGDDSSEDSLAKRKAEAQKEVDRILEADRTGRPILVGSDAEERRVAFRNIVLFLHPDLALVSADDANAIKALNISLKAFVQSEVGSAK